MLLKLEKCTVSDAKHRIDSIAAYTSVKDIEENETYDLETNHGIIDLEGWTSTKCLIPVR